jgi:tetratricopeptide (TPR) repeat protein
VPLPHIEALLEEGKVAEGVGELHALAAQQAVQPGALAEAGQLFTHLNLHVEAEQCFRRAAELEPASAAHLYNWATGLIALGRLDEAEAALSKVLALTPADYDAYYNRATLRRQSADRNHVAQLQAALSQPIRHPGGVVALCYALAKELEDLGEYRQAFAVLRRGADTRRRMLSYRIEEDELTMAQIAQAFDAHFFASPCEGFPDARPIFIVGLPRSGTTLVDRILSSHSQVISRGESNDLAKALVREVGAASSKAQLIERSARVDFRSVGERYCQRLDTSPQVRTIDKNPVNFLYLGVLARALPQAHIIHVRRDPMDLCYAIYKTLFRMAYPFSYDLQDIARYYAAYERLMGHWRAMLPESFLEVQYEHLIAEQEAVSRRLLQFCDLPWEPGCLTFERNTAPCLTASAAQVRQPLYSSSVGQWRRYREELEPLARALRSVGVEVDVRPGQGDAA